MSKIDSFLLRIIDFTAYEKISADNMRQKRIVRGLE